MVSYEFTLFLISKFMKVFSRFESKCSFLEDFNSFILNRYVYVTPLHNLWSKSKKQLSQNISKIFHWNISIPVIKCKYFFYIIGMKRTNSTRTFHSNYALLFTKKMSYFTRKHYHFCVHCAYYNGYLRNKSKFWLASVKTHHTYHVLVHVL